MSDETERRRGQVLAAIASSGDGGVSGEQVAQDLGCSRAAVHRHVEALRRDGIAIEGAHGGYRLADGADPVVPDLVAPRLAPPVAGPVRWSAQTGSTNDDIAAEARAGAPEGLVIGADFQRTGRGRRGRTWLSDPGDALMFSVLLRPPVAAADAALLPIVVAVAVAEALGPRTRVVWPNDIVIDRRKVCGILCESAADESGLAWAVVGIGVNVRAAPVVPDARWTAGCLADVGDPPARTDLLVELLTRLGARYEQWTSGDVRGILDAYAGRDALAGVGVGVAVHDGEVAGTASGLDEAGRLRVVGPAGERALAAGEVVRVAFELP